MYKVLEVSSALYFMKMDVLSFLDWPYLFSSSRAFPFWHMYWVTYGA